MERRRKFTREFKLEAVRLIKERGVSYAQASQRGIPSTGCLLSRVFQMVGKSFPLRTASVHKRARSFARSCDIVKINAQTPDERLI